MTVITRIPNPVATLLLVTAFLLAACAEQPMPLDSGDGGENRETSPEALVGQPIQIGNALSVSALTRAGGAVETDSDFPQVGSTMTVFLTIPAADTPDRKPHRMQANYTCTARTSDETTHTVTSATWTADDTEGNTPLCWQYADARHIFAAISPAAVLQSGESPAASPATGSSLTLTEYPVEYANGTEGTGSGETPLPAATFTLPATFDDQSYEYWRSLRTTYQPSIVAQPTATPVALKMRRALTEVEILGDLISVYRSAMFCQVPRTAFFNPTTGEVTALRTGITATPSSGDGSGGASIPDYAIGGNLAGIGNITAHTIDAWGMLHHALLLPTAYHESGDNRCDGSGTLSYIFTDEEGTSYLYKNDIPAGMDADGSPVADGGFCPGSVLQIMSGVYNSENNAILHCDGTYTGGAKVIDELNRLKVLSTDTNTIPFVLLTGPLGEREQEIMQALADMAKAKATEFVYVEQAHEITDGLFKDCSSITTFVFPKVTKVGSKVAYAEPLFYAIDTDYALEIAYIPEAKEIASDAFSGCKNFDLCLSGTDENGSFFLPKYTKDADTTIYDLYLIDLPEGYFETEAGALLDDERQRQLDKCVEFIGAKYSSHIKTGDLSFGS